MTAITNVSARAVPVHGNDIDTDRIIPARFLRCVTFDGLGEHAFADDRLHEQQAGRTHPLDDARYAGAGILVVNANFGCGSSREHAPQALKRWGIQAIVGVSFAEIFFGNCVALGIPCATVSVADAAAIQAAIEADPGASWTLDVAAGTLTKGQTSYPATIPAGPRKMLLEGQWDATAQLLDGLAEARAVAARLPYMCSFSA